MDLQVIDYFGKGTLLGLAAGFSPGPLTVLVIGETLRHGLRSGLQVAIAPILTDIPIILLTMLILEKALNYPVVFGAISLAGGAFLLWLGYASMRTQGMEIRHGRPGSAIHPQRHRHQSSQPQPLCLLDQRRHADHFESAGNIPAPRRRFPGVLFFLYRRLKSAAGQDRGRLAHVS